VGVLAAIAVICALRVGGEFTARAFFSVHLDGTWGVSTARIGGALALSNLLSIPAPLVTPALVQRWGRVLTITVGAAGVALSIVALGLAADWVMASAAFVALTVIAAMTRSVWSLVVQESVSEGWRTTSAGVANLFSGLGTMAMSSAGGVMAASMGYRSTFLASAALVGLGAAAVWGAFGRRRPLQSGRSEAGRPGRAAR
jgi:predicted MFS family arabinose efflux permease